MFLNYLKTALRNLVRLKTYSIINILGLSIGLTVSFIILIFLFNEYSYDNYTKNQDLIFRLICKDNVFNTNQPNTPYALAPNLKTNFPDVSKAARTKRLGVSIQNGQNFIPAKNFVSADGEIFEILTLPLVSGNPKTVLNSPNSVTISENIADKYFQNRDPVGNVLRFKIYGDIYTFRITGVFKNIPNNSTFRANYIASIDAAKNYYENVYSGQDIRPHEQWDILAYNTYIQFFPNFNITSFKNNLADYIKIYDQQNRFKYDLQPLKDIYLYSSNLINDPIPKGNLTNIYLFSAIAFLILIIAAINYIILFSARTTIRLKEIGLRKVVGAKRLDLFRQIIIESLCFAFIALPFALMLLELLLPFVNRLLGDQIDTHYLQSWHFILSFFTVTFVIGCFSGTYVSFYFSKFQPVEVLNSKITVKTKKSNFKRGLIAVQMTISITLISASIIVYQQLNFAQNQFLGFDKEQLLTISFQDRETRDSYQVYKNEIKTYPNILKISGASYVPPTDGWTRSSFSDPNDPDKLIEMEGIYVDNNFIETLGLRLIKGRQFSPDFFADPGEAIILNETAAKIINLKNPVGNKFSGSTIVGIVNDFHIHSFRHKIEPLMIHLGPKYVAEMIIRIKPDDVSKTVTFIQEKWQLLNSNTPFK